MPDTEFPFRDFESRLVIPAGAPGYTSGGFIPYWPDPLTYSERYTEGAGVNTTVSLNVDGETAADFLKFGLGFSRAVTKTYNGSPRLVIERYLPLALPYNNKLFLSDLVMTQGGGWQPHEGFDQFPDWPWLIYRASYTDRPYEIVADSALPAYEAPPVPLASGWPDELGRFVERVHRPAGRERKVPNYQVELDDGTPVPEPAFIVDRYVEWVYTVYRWPYAVYPKTAIGGLMGCVNAYTFDAIFGVGMNAAPGTVLYVGPASEIKPYRGRDGNLYCDYSVVLRYRSYGWNKYLRPSDDPFTATPVGWRFRLPGGSTTRRPYPIAELHALFEPEGAYTTLSTP